MNIDEANAAYYQADSKASQSAVSLADNFDDFLTMLTTQLQNQDPLNPTDSNEFTNQLVSFTGVEQSIATNQNLEALIQLQSISQQNNEATVLIDYLGKTVGSNTNLSTLESDGASWNIELGVAADEMTYEIYNENGVKVHNEAASTTTSAGQHVFSWDGSLSNGGQAPEGLYYLVPTATTDGGSTVDVGFQFEGLATKVETMNGQPVLMVNDVPLGLSDITTVKIADLPTEGA